MSKARARDIGCDDASSPDNYTKEMELEYQALRQEIMQWQDRRFIVIGTTIAFVSALVGAIATKPGSCSWALATSLLLAFLSAAVCLIRQFARFNSTIGAYLEVFHGSPWERRIKEFRRRSSIYFELNPFVAVIFLLLVLLR